MAEDSREARMTRRPQHILMIYNPAAGRARTRLFDRVVSCLRAAGAKVDIKRTEYAGHARDLAQQHRQGPYDRICAAGGDGTINEVINGLYPAPLPLGVIPLGTANVLAKELLSRESAEVIAETILHGEMKKCWLGTAGDRYFSLMASMGPDAEAVRRVNLRLKKHLGKVAYALAFLQQILTRRDATYHVTIDGKDHQAAAVIITRSKYYGGQYICAPDAGLDRKAFQVILMTKHGRRAALGYAVKMLRHKIPSDRSVRIIPATSLTIRADRPAACQLDGDPGPGLPLSLGLAQQPLTVLWDKSRPRTK